VTVLCRLPIKFLLLFWGLVLVGRVCISIPKKNPKEIFPELWSKSRASIVDLAAEIGRSRLEAMFRKEVGLSLREARIISSAHEVKAHQKALAEFHGINSNVMVGIIDDLEKRGHVRRVRNPKNRREYFIEPTTKGRRAVDKLAANWRAYANLTFPSLTQEEIDTFAAYSQRVIDAYYEGMGKGR